jgi:penicillin-insensitive murein endopeptidase
MGLLLMSAAPGPSPAAAQSTAATAQPPAAATPTPAPAAPAQAPAPAVTKVKVAPKPPVAAKQLFGAVKTAAPLAARSIGFYARGCLAGARPLAIDGPAWQAMRLSRNRNWGHPAMIEWLERFAKETQAGDGWPGLLVGDISQPRGGPMLTGHASHQVGLDADIWLTPMPHRRLTEKEREEISAISMLADDKVSVDPNVWSDTRARIIKRAASFPEVERIFVHPAIKKALCDAAPSLGSDKSWMSKVRAYWGHYYHFHVRLHCPKDSPGCKAQDPVPSGDGCGAELTDWLKRIAAPPQPPPAKPAPPKPPITLANLPAECRVVLDSGKAPVAASVTAAPEAKPATAPASVTAPAQGAGFGTAVVKH